MRIITLGSGSTGNCYLLELNNKTIVLDCGLKFEDITKDINFPKFRNISFVFVSHSPYHTVTIINQ